MRLDKYLAHAQLGTRKEVKSFIRKGHVTVNDVLCKKDDCHIDEKTDMIRVDDELIQFDPIIYIMLHKPAGVVSATMDEVHETVLDCIDIVLPRDSFPVGRLDIDTEGLLLITNDGKLAHRLLSPKHHVDKTYYIEMEHPLADADIETLTNGSILLDDEQVLPAKLVDIQETNCKMILQEGRFHQVKRMFHAVSNEVLFLKRIQMGSLQLDEELKVGEWRYLSDVELNALQEHS